LWHWREREAIAANRPPFFILRHEDLVGIAEAAAARRAFQPLIPRHLSDRRRAGLAAAVKAGLQLSPEQFPEIPRHRGRRASEAERRRGEEITRRRDRQAARLGLDPTLIASRAMIAELAQDWDRHAPKLMSWQRELLT
jgi:ribonuclease D